MAKFRKFWLKNVEESGDGKKFFKRPQNIMVFASAIADDHNNNTDNNH